MKKTLLISLLLIVTISISVFLRLQYIEQQKVAARVAIDKAFGLLDSTKDNYIDRIKGSLDEKISTELNKSSHFFSQGLDKHDQAEKAFTDEKYSEAISLANESVDLMNTFRNRIDGLGIGLNIKK
jgi:hypothetical protein